MAGAAGVRSTWTRRVPGWAFLVFFVSLIVLTYFAVDFSNRNDPITAGYLAALASVVPIALVVLVYVGRPVWAMNLPLDGDGVARALAKATSGRTVHPVAEREGPFARCVSVVQFEDPPCLRGWHELPALRGAQGSAERTILLFRPAGRDRKALAAFRRTLAESLGRSVSVPA